MNDDDNNDEWTIEFAPNCFDNFEGTQEELDELVDTIRKMVATGELFEKAVPVDMDDLDDETGLRLNDSVKALFDGKKPSVH